MKAYGGVDVQTHVFFFTSALAGGEWSASRPGRFTPGNEPPVPTEVGWTPEPVCKRWRSENSWPYRGSNSDSSIVQLVAIRYTDCDIPALLYKRNSKERTERTSFNKIKHIFKLNKNTTGKTLIRCRECFIIPVTNQEGPILKGI
jgi:hypothetical protein